MYLETTTAGVVKLFWYGFVLTLFAVLAIPWTQLLILAWLMLLDCITWVAKQYVIDKTEITSHNWTVGLIKKLVVIAVFFAVAILLTWLGLPLADRWIFLSAILSIFQVAEAYSILGNAYTIRTWKKMKEYDAISYVIKKLMDFVGNILENKIGKIWK